MIISGQVSGGTVIERIKTLAGKLRAELEHTVHLVAEAVKTKAQYKVSGPVLKAPTGALSGSINVKDHFEPTSILATVGINLGSIPYARIHEYGGIINHPGGTAYFVGKDGVAVFVSNAAATGKSYKRTGPHKIVMPERSYLRSSLAEMEASIVAAIRASLKRAIVDSGLAS